MTEGHPKGDTSGARESYTCQHARRRTRFSPPRTSPRAWRHWPPPCEGPIRSGVPSSAISNTAYCSGMQETALRALRGSVRACLISQLPFAHVALVPHARHSRCLRPPRRSPVPNFKPFTFHRHPSRPMRSSSRQMSFALNVKHTSRRHEAVLHLATRRALSSASLRPSQIRWSYTE